MAWIRSWWSSRRGDEVCINSKSTPPLGITMVNDAVYKFSEPTITPPQVEIVFIHGLRSSDHKDAYWKTWMGGKENEICWPMKWLSEDFPGARIWSLSYDSCALRTDTTGRMDIYALGESLIQSMVGLANIGQEDCPIVFVCHCLGGLVVKEMIIQAHGKFEQDLKYKKFLQNIRGFFFYATPHDGLNLLADMPSHLEKSKLVEQLRVIDDYLGRLNAEFERIGKDHYADKWRFSVVAETHETTLDGFSVKGVEEASARHGYEKFLSVGADHFGVCTPETKKSSSFLSVKMFVEDIVKESMLSGDQLLILPSPLVGIELKLQVVREKMKIHSGVGLVGMGGIGKTTLSKHVYNEEIKHFEKSCFLENVKSASIGDSQRQLFNDLCGKLDGNQIIKDFHLHQIRRCIMTKKVLLVVDDVGSEENLKALLVDAFKSGEKGSKVIVTTRRKDFLIGPLDPGGIVDLEFLNEGEALELFSHYAFDRLDMQEKLDLDGLAKDISKACGGLPLSIEVVGQFLRKYNLEAAYSGKRKGLWEKTLDKLQEAKSLDGSKDDKLWATLKISYDDLDDNHKSMFLDFACIFSDWDYFKSHRNWWKLPLSDAQRWDFNEVVEYLGRIWGDLIGVHTLLNRSLIKWNSKKRMLVIHDQLRDLGRSIANKTRIWVHYGECPKFLEQSLNTLEGLFLTSAPNPEWKSLRGKCFGKLRMLAIFRGWTSKVVDNVSLLSEELRWLRLGDCTLSSRSIQKLGLLQKLRVLEMIGCGNLQELPESIGNLHDLMELDLSNCMVLRSLPESIGRKLKSLEVLHATGCDSLETVCVNGTKMHHFNLSNCRKLKTIKLLGNLHGLKTLNLCSCNELDMDHLCDDLGQLQQLEYLDLCGCSKLKGGIAMTIQKGQLHTDRLEWLGLPVIPEVELPACPRLLSLKMENGMGLMEFAISPSKLPKLEYLELRGSVVKVLPGALCNLEQLKWLRISDFKVLKMLPESLGQLSQLQYLNLKDCKALEYLPESLGQLSQLQNLNLQGCKAVEFLPGSLGQLSQLKNLNLNECKALKFLPESLGQLSQLQKLDLVRCPALKHLPEFLGQLSQLQIASAT